MTVSRQSLRTLVMMAALFASTGLALSGCDAEHASPSAKGGTEERSRRAVRSRSEGATERPPTRPSEPAKARAERTAPSGPNAIGCSMVGEPTRVMSVPGPSSVAVNGEDLVVVAYGKEESGERLTLARLRELERPELLGTHRLESAVRQRVAGPGIVVTRGRVRITAIDGRGRVLVLDHPGEPGGAFEAAVVAKQADARFRPAMRQIGSVTSIAHTRASDSGMRVVLSRVGIDRKVKDTTDLTLEGLSGTAATFVRGQTPPTLVYLDARAGVSPVVEVPFDEVGAARPASVARPVSSPYEPPVLAAVESDDQTLLAYTALGSAATTAIGLVTLEEEGAPIPLLKGEGYGLLHVAGAPAGEDALFSMDRPTGASPSSPRSVVLRRVHGDSLSEPLEIAQATSPMPLVDIASDGDTVVALSYTGKDGVYAARLRCPNPATP